MRMLFWIYFWRSVSRITQTNTISAVFWISWKRFSGSKGSQIFRKTLRSSDGFWVQSRGPKLIPSVLKTTWLGEKITSDFGLQELFSVIFLECKWIHVKDGHHIGLSQLWRNLQTDDCVDLEVKILSGKISLALKLSNPYLVYSC